jgi:hypothetical protein
MTIRNRSRSPRVSGGVMDPLSSLIVL